MKTLAIYYSRTGNTRKVGQMISYTLKCDSDEIIETNKRTGIWGWLMAGKAGTRKEITKIEPPTKNLADYDLVVIGTPIHSWGLSAPVRTYLRENKGKFNKVAFFCTCGSTGMERAFVDMEAESGKKPVAVMAITGKELKEEVLAEKISGFIKSVNQ
jgi:flavodoxin